MRFIPSVCAALAIANTAFAAHIHTGPRKRDEETLFPGALGPSDKPEIKDLDDAFKNLDSQSPEYGYLTSDNSPFKQHYFWPTLLALTKLTPEREWIKSMFDDSKTDEGHIGVQMFKDGKSESYAIPRKPVQEAKVGDARWPLYLAAGAKEAGCDPLGADPHSLLEILTGFKAKMDEVTDDDEAAKKLADKAGWNPVITASESGTQPDPDHTAFVWGTVMQGPNPDDPDVIDYAKFTERVRFSQDELVEPITTRWLYRTGMRKVVTLDDTLDKDAFEGFGGRPSGA